MRALKILVVVMGVVLVAGTIVLVVAVANRINHPPATAPATRVSDIELPPGARVSGTATSGDRLVVTITLADESEELLIFNLGTGAPIATINLRKQAPAP
jgi:hypothetical protein